MVPEPHAPDATQGIKTSLPASISCPFRSPQTEFNTDQILIYHLYHRILSLFYAHTERRADYLIKDG